MKKSIKRILSVVLATAVVASSALSMEVSAASKAKVAFNVYCFTADNKWLAGDGNGNQKVSKVVTVKKGKAVNVTLTVKGAAKKGIQVLTVDSGNSTLSGSTKGILSSFKKCKYSNVVVKCDGKVVKAPSMQGYFESDTKTESWRLSFYNTYGSNGDDTKTKCKSNAKKIKFKKSLQVSFSFVAK